ncbi:MAG: 4Fe-4S cluster-binding domain-containing protein [Deltaproteobacteria bacterium]|nr:4Fe-4S cluster-binding domain-containing protein [Deltaproteobacteria bacterium]
MIGKSPLNIHAVLPASTVNGPGSRMVIFFQGCTKGCRGCFNPDTHPIGPRESFSVEDIFSRFYSTGLEGITVSGGEPFLQHDGLMDLLKAARERYNLNTVVYTGFPYEDILETTALSICLPYIDVLIDGSYEDERKEKSLLARGSTNQRFHFLTDHYDLADFHMPGKVEVIIGSDGMIKETGFSRIDILH